MICVFGTIIVLFELNLLKQHNYETINYTSDDIRTHEYDGMGRPNDHGFCQQFGHL